MVKGSKANEKKKRNLLNHYNSGNYDTAKKLAKALCKKYPNDSFSWMLLGLILKEYGNMEEALSASQKSIDLSPNDEVAINCYGIVLKHFGKFNEAEKIFNEAIILKPEFAEPYNNLGIILKILGRNEEAKENYLKAINLKSNFTEAYNNLGVLLKSLGNYNEAFEYHKKVISITPNNDKAYYFMGIILYELDKLQEAQTCFEKSVSLNPENTESKHLLSALMGEKTNSAPKEYVEKLFDDFASTFDDHLVEDLEYKTPKIISNVLIQSSEDNFFGSVLDLGCGTGLVGQEIKTYSKKLIGIDLSKGMLEKAKLKNVYDELKNDDIEGYLINEFIDFDIFIASDVFVYIGDLSNIFRLIKSENQSNGKLIFTTEHNIKNHGFELEKTGRYSHSKTYINNLCDQFGYHLRYFDIVKLRKDKDILINGGIYLLEF